MNELQLLAISPVIFLVSIGIFGLIIGSFLNVVILRLPKILYQNWAEQCCDFIQKHPTYFNDLLHSTFLKQADASPYNLIISCSHCPYCQHPISALENIPLLSFIFLKGRCRICHAPISWRYPVIELITASFSILTAYQLGWTWFTLAGLVLTWGLIALAGIDYDHHLLPDNIVLPGLWLGLAINLHIGFVPLQSAVIGAVCGYLFLWIVFWIFKFCTGKEGMGFGDFKLLALLGAWLGWQALPAIILISSLLGASLGIVLLMLKRHKRGQPLPFGPFLALAGWISMLWGGKINHYYLKATHFL